MRDTSRQIVRQRYVFQCGYCGIQENDAGSELTIDHFQPRSQGGTDEMDNLVYCCHACNEYKGDYWQPTSIHRLLHPMQDEIERHIAEADDGLLQSLTETGHFHIEKLRLNRSGLVARRRERQRQETDRALLRSIDQRTKSIKRQNAAILAEFSASRQAINKLREQ